MARYAGGGKTTVESCRSIDVLDWHRRGYLRSPQWFSWVWSRDGERVASINVGTSAPICDLEIPQPLLWRGLERCSSSASPSRGHPAASVASGPGLHVRSPQTRCTAAAGSSSCTASDGLFACRHCYRLAYTSQQESAHQRGLWKSQKIRMRLGGSANMRDLFPEKPKGMQRRNYDRLRRLHDAAEQRSMIGLIGLVERLGPR